MHCLDLDAFRCFEHDDLARGFGAPHIFDCQVIYAHAVQVANPGCSAFFDQSGCTANRIGVVGARFCRVDNDGVRAGEVFQMEPHGVLWGAFDERIIFGLVCAYLDRIVAVENLGVHVNNCDLDWWRYLVQCFMFY